MVNSGTNGQAGGDAGDGGNGGNGQQGGRAVPNRGPFGIVLGCASGPGSGGHGGHAGYGGPGGHGGHAGHGGNLYFVVKLSKANFRLSYDLSRGEPGRGGRGGQPGHPGDFGWGGRGNTGCSGRENGAKASQVNPRRPGLTESRVLRRTWACTPTTSKIFLHSKRT